MLYQNNIQPVGAGIYENTDLGLLSLSSDGTNWITMKNHNNIGGDNQYCYYQWGNNYGFGRGEINISDELVDASVYGPGNYYSSNIFITPTLPFYFDWSSVTNDNLWGNITGTYLAMRGPCEEGFHVPSDNDLISMKAVMDNFSLSTFTQYISYLNIERTDSRSYRNGRIVSSDVDYALLWSSSGKKFLVRTDRDPFLNGNIIKAAGCQIRAFRNEPIIPNDTRTIKYQP